MVITIFDVLGIQDYLFGSNKLIENIGGSYLVEQAMDTWLPDVAEKLGLTDKLVYNAGGNAVFQLDDLKKEAWPLSKEFSKVVMEQAPGLQVACCHYQAQQGTSLGQALQDAFYELRQVKADRTRGDQKLLGLGVAQPCESGMREPAVGSPKSSPRDNRFLGPAALAKVESREKAHKRLEEYFPDVPGGYDFPFELDDLGRSMGEKSYIGVVHMDGNGIGDELQNIFKQSLTDQVLKIQIQDFSKKIKNAGLQAIQRAVYLLFENNNIIQKRCAASFELKKKSGEILLPFRPLVYGGDDITFVCDGRIALDLASSCLTTFHEQSGYHACAGVALCKSHYPFYRAYSLSEQLCRNAKENIRNNEREGSAIDWHILSGGPVREIHDIRDTEYRRKEVDGTPFTLTCKPYQVLPQKNDLLWDWSQFRNHLLSSLQNDQTWIQAHSRLKGLVTPLSRGPQAAKDVLSDWKTKGYELPVYAGLPPEEGFEGSVTPYLDALELLDFMVFLNS